MALGITCMFILAAAAFMLWALVVLSREQQRSGNSLRRTARNRATPQILEVHRRPGKVLVLHPRVDRAKHAA